MESKVTHNNVIGSGSEVMTVKQVAEVLGCSPETVKVHIRELFPDLMQERKTTHLTLSHCEKIKMRMNLLTHPNSLVVKGSSESDKLYLSDSDVPTGSGVSQLGFLTTAVGSTTETQTEVVKWVEQTQRMLNAIQKEVTQERGINLALAEGMQILEGKVEDLEIRLNESNTYWTLRKYDEVKNMEWTTEFTQRLGKALTRYCKERSIELRDCEVHGMRYSKVKSYPLIVIEEFLARGFE